MPCSGFGTFLLAPVMQLLNDNYGWNYTLVIIGTLVFVCIPFGVLFRLIIHFISDGCPSKYCRKPVVHDEFL